MPYKEEVQDKGVIFSREEERTIAYITKMSREDNFSFEEMYEEYKRNGILGDKALRFALLTYAVKNGFDVGIEINEKGIEVRDKKKAEKFASTALNELLSFTALKDNRLVLNENSIFVRAGSFERAKKFIEELDKIISREEAFDPESIVYKLRKYYSKSGNYLDYLEKSVLEFWNAKKGFSLSVIAEEHNIDREELMGIEGKDILDYIFGKDIRRIVEEKKMEDKAVCFLNGVCRIVDGTAKGYNSKKMLKNIDNDFYKIHEKEKRSASHYLEYISLMRDISLSLQPLEVGLEESRENRMHNSSNINHLHHSLEKRESSVRKFIESVIKAVIEEIKSSKVPGSWEVKELEKRAQEYVKRIDVYYFAENKANEARERLVEEIKEAAQEVREKGENLA